MTALVARLEGDERFRRLARTMSSGRGGTAGGLWGSSVALFLAALARQAPGPLLAVVASSEDADQLAEDLPLFSPQEACLFPVWEAPPSEDTFPGALQSQRLAVVRRLMPGANAPPPKLLIAPVHALLQPVPDAEALAKGTLEFRVGGRHRLEAVAEWLVERGLQRVTAVEGAGEFSIRGGILDVYALAAPKPCRVEFFGDEVESVRTFDLATQRSDARLDACEVVALPGKAIVQSAQGGPRSLLHQTNHSAPGTEDVRFRACRVVAATVSGRAESNLCPSPTP